MTTSGFPLLTPGLVPMLETERLQLRGLDLADFEFYADLWADPDVVRYITKEPLKEEDSWYGFLRLVGHWSLMGYGYWAAVEKKTQELVGVIGFVDFKRAITPSLKGEPEIGWVFAASAHGKGYATEAARAAIAWGDERFGGARMSCIIDIAHSGSIRVAEKCGFKETVRTTYKDDAIVILHREAPG